ncbi:MAG TPA: GIY-YIG nuclease family protein [Patescibacteria group bacterium]
MQYFVSQYLSLPQKPGVYQFLNEHGEILYVGKAKNLKNRVSSYFSSPGSLIGKTAVLVSQVKKIKITIVESELESLLLEASLIKKYEPKYNIRLTDGKAYPLIRITIKSKFPAVITARRPEDKLSIYFGPFPNSSAMRMVLKTIRKIFPYQSVVNHPNKKCLYNHLGLCPCPPTFKTIQEIKDYKRNLKHLIDFLDGQTKKVLKELEKEREGYAKLEMFEKAGKIQKQIESIYFVTQPFHSPFEYQTNPHLRSDLRQKELESLQKILAENGVQIDFPERIECYDNSNFQGSNPTSSMVVLTNGEIDKSQYRKFKVKNVKGPNDFETMKEVLTRRLKHTEWTYPQLIIIDGGKGQVSAAIEAVEGFYSSREQSESRSYVDTSKHPQKLPSLPIPVIGLAKREETIITSNMQEIHISKHSPALQLVMRIRDEAHRFAITFHRSLRSKKAFT